MAKKRDIIKKEMAVTGRTGAVARDITIPMVSAAGRGLTTITGADTAWMSPSNPVTPIAPQTAGRQYDYPVATNLNIRPRATEATSFAELRTLADIYYLVRLAIETRKDQLVKLQWKIKPIDPKAKTDARCEELTAFFKQPDKRHGWQEWMRMLVEDVLVIDAPAVYYRANYGKKPYAFEIIDGATIKVLLDEFGRAPLPPDPAYQQNIKGVPTVNYTSDELIYKPRNPRSWKAYGYSPVEQIVMIVNIGLRRAASQLQHYTEGNIPEAIATTPESWSPDQIKEYQLYWDTMMEGNTAQRRHMKFVAGGMDIHETKSAMLTDAFDEWLARVVSYCFSLPVTAFVKQNNRATADSAKEQAEEEGLVPVMQWLSDYINYLIVKYWGYTDIHFAWDEEKSIDPLTQAQINQIYLTTDVLDKNEVRSELGYDPRNYDAEAKLKNEAMQAMQPPPPAQGKPENKVAPASENEGVKKKTYAKLSTTNVARAKKLAGSYTKFFKKLKKQAIGQLLTAYATATAEKAFAGVDDLQKNSTDDIIAGLELDFDAIIDVSVKNLKNAALEGTDNAIGYLQGAGAVFDPQEIAEGVANYNAAQLVTNINESTRNMLYGNIDTAMKEGWTTNELADKLAANYAFSEARAETIARTEIAFADMQGSMEAYRQSGVVTGKKWLLAEEPCDICEGNAKDGIIGLDNVFSSGDDAAPAHPNCECDVAPVIADDNEE